PFCQNSSIQKYGTQNNIQRYKCSTCHKTFTLTKKLESSNIWQDYTVGKQSYKQLAEKYHCSVRTIQRYLLKAPKTPLNPSENKYLNLIIDTTFFGRKFGVMVFMDSHTKKVIYHQIVKTEKAIYYAVAINRLREKGHIIQSITCDGKRGLLKDIFDTPIQLCQFHQVAIVTRKLTRKPKSKAGIALKELVARLKSSLKNEFYRELHHWYLNYKDYIDERSEYPNEKGHYLFKHRKLRSAYTSLLRNQDYLFTFEKYPELNMDKTTNRIENLF
ncbi:IS256 family transposase, variant Zn-binding type, partial [Lonepinella sp. BR2357]|uniref:IS256 family transposase, variant Zn-binding type n=1 Tax=Lonepinella sp. BR2357 TaxID=3434549 RepID=UPI003F6DDB44